MVMQVLVLATQNAVDQKDLGVATSGATFFRSLGGAMGVAGFGALLTHELRETIPARLAAAGVPVSPTGGGPRLGSPEQIAALPEPIHTAVITGFADALQTTFLAAAPFALLGFVVILFLKELPLRKDRPTHTDGESLGAAFETGVDPDANLGYRTNGDGRPSAVGTTPLAPGDQGPSR
jgi:hypothetical protein